jgi:hypothetical protein
MPPLNLPQLQHEGLADLLKREPLAVRVVAGAVFTELVHLGVDGPLANLLTVLAVVVLAASARKRVTPV